jgi:radical SAM superfamily enzyme YgiQ (UPF0313 family)
MRWETQRGCIYACTFCQHRAADARQRPGLIHNSRIAKEVDALVQGGAQDIAVLDPIFHTNPGAIPILERFSQPGYGGRLSLQSRFELVSEAFLDACMTLNIRLEFGLQTTHRKEMRAIRRINDLDAADRVIQQLHQRNIPFEISLIYGLPEQTLSSFRASVQWCIERGVPVVHAFPLMLLRGTLLEQNRERWGLIESRDRIPVVMESNTFSQEEWGEMREMAEGLESLINSSFREQGTKEWSHGPMPKKYSL